MRKYDISRRKNSNIFIYHSLRTSSPGRSGGVVGKEGELATSSLEFEFRVEFPCGSLTTSFQISANQREAETSADWRI